MGLGNAIKNKVMAAQKQKARDRQYKIEADAEIKKKADAAYYKAKEEKAIEDARAKAKRGGFKDRLKAGLKSTSKGMRERQKANKGRNMGLGSVSMGGSGPDFGLSNSSAFDLSVNKKKKGPFDL